MNTSLNSSLQGSTIVQQPVPGAIISPQIVQQPLQNSQILMPGNQVPVPQNMVIQVNPPVVAPPQFVVSNQPQTIMVPQAYSIAQPLVQNDSGLKAELKPRKELRVTVVVFSSLILLLAFIDFIVSISVFETGYVIDIADSIFVSAIAILMIFYYWKSDDRVFKQMVGTISIVYWALGAQARTFKFIFHYYGSDIAIYEIVMNVFRSIFLLIPSIIILATIRSYRV